jgi:hypothetical protein
MNTKQVKVGSVNPLQAHKLSFEGGQAFENVIDY